MYVRMYVNVFMHLRTNVIVSNYVITYVGR